MLLVVSDSSAGSLVWSGSGVHFYLALPLVYACSIRFVIVGMGRGFLHDATQSVISLRGRLRGVGLVSGVGFVCGGGGSLGSIVFCA